MKLAIVFLGLAILAAGKGTRAQSGEPSKPEQAKTEATPLTQPVEQPEQSQRVQQEPRQILPDNPIPTAPSPVDGPYPCPGGVGKPCALLAGRSFFPDLSRMTQHESSLKDSLKNPVMLAGMGSNFAALIWDYKTTRAGIDSGRCKEGNPLMGQSRAQELGVGLSLTAVVYLSAAILKKEGRGNTAFGILAAGALLHVAAAAHNRAVCSN
jgi:hypothetical protein